MQKNLLIIGAVWPEPNSSAAGSRMMQLIDLFLAENYAITFASATTESNYRFPLEELGIVVKSIALNNESFDAYLKTLQSHLYIYPSIVENGCFVQILHAISVWFILIL